MQCWWDIFALKNHSPGSLKSLVHCFIKVQRNAGIYNMNLEFSSYRHFRPFVAPSYDFFRCGWKSYVGKEAFRAWGFSPQEFELVCWMTGACAAAETVERRL
jgi:hypothetical protein